MDKINEAGGEMDNVKAASVGNASYKGWKIGTSIIWRPIAIIIKYLYNNYMKTIIIVINILLLSLILYSLLSKGDKVLENMAGCPSSGAAGTNKKLLDRLYQEVATHRCRNRRIK